VGKDYKQTRSGGYYTVVKADSSSAETVKVVDKAEVQTKIAEIAKANDDDKTKTAQTSMSIKADTKDTDVTVTFNSTAVAALSSALSSVASTTGKTVTSVSLDVTTTDTKDATAEVQTAAASIKSEVKTYFSAEIFAKVQGENNTKHQLFSDGATGATATVDLTMDAPADGKVYKVYYIAKGQAPVLQTSSYKNGVLSVTLEHFSDYAIVEVDKPTYSGGGTLSEIYKLDPKSTTTNGKSAVTVALDGAAASFKFVRIDGYLVESANVTVNDKELTIAAAAFAGLKDGDHRIDVIFTDGKAVGTLVIDSTAASSVVVTDTPVANPSTGAAL
jgi:hypothetical protein